ncbi:pinensin family lanthipeptide [Roseivirga sp. BDSF3-8]|uniref:pinensin family lanthipeptide n=1 Tax=Roseivirga sp. BDSF3-8 TaxID=3241598 RepID=UPI003531843A
MKRKKMNLSTLQVESFQTGLSDKGSREIAGGSKDPSLYNCTYNEYCVTNFGPGEPIC